MKEENLSMMAGPLLSWYAENKRTLPWRGTGDPYCVLVSEIMLHPHGKEKSPSLRTNELCYWVTKLE